MEFTLEELEEFYRCYKDPIYFIENYIKINTSIGSAFHRIIFHGNTNVSAYSNTPKSIIKSIKQIHKSLPNFLSLAIIKEGETEIEFENGSTISYLDLKSIQGKNYNFVFFDELEFS